MLVISSHVALELIALFTGILAVLAVLALVRR